MCRDAFAKPVSNADLFDCYQLSSPDVQLLPPVGMVGRSGSIFPAELVAGRDWAFDAVYTPIETSFLQNARAAGLSVMSGYELFIGQGVDAFRLFTGRDVDYTTIRNALQG
jgi:shikimate dehydrogenase